MRSRLTRQTWGRRSQNITVLSMTATTTLSTTTEHLGSSVDLGEYREGVFLTSVVANSTGAPTMTIQGSFDNSTWFGLETIHGDLTTTANTSGEYIPVLPRYIRAKLTPYTTTIPGIIVNVTADVLI